MLFKQPEAFISSIPTSHLSFRILRKFTRHTISRAWDCKIRSWNANSTHPSCCPASHSHLDFFGYSFGTEVERFAHIGGGNDNFDIFQQFSIQRWLFYVENLYWCCFIIEIFWVVKVIDHIRDQIPTLASKVNPIWTDHISPFRSKRRYLLNAVISSWMVFAF